MANMIVATDLRAGATFLLDGKPYLVVKYTHSKIARGGGTVKLSVRNLVSGKLKEKTLNSNAKVDDIETVKKPLQFLYKDASNAVFIDGKSYEQVEIPLSIIKNDLPFVKEGENVDILFWDDKPLSVEIPPKVDLAVEETAPGVKGDSATNIFKPATLENGLKVKVPLFIKAGDKVRVDTRTGKYVERVKQSLALRAK